MASGITSASTTAEVLAALEDGLAYVETGSVEAAKAAARAARVLVARLPTASGNGSGSNVSYSKAELLEIAREATAFVSQNAPNQGRVIHLSAEGFRR